MGFGGYGNAGCAQTPAGNSAYCTADAILLANILPQAFSPSLKRVVVFSSTSVVTKQDTEIATEREKLRKLAEAEQRITAICEQRRIFDALHLPRRTISIPPALWRLGFALAKPLFPVANVAMGIRMTNDMMFDATPAIRDFGWNPRAFHPVFD